ncbi:hypothetical protein ACTPOE_05635 [Castellaniella sp. WN]
MSGSTSDQIPSLTIEHVDDGSGGGLIVLEQEGGGSTDRVALHPVHLRYLAEKFGLVESGDVQAQKTIATLRRRLLMLNDRIAHLTHYLADFSDHEHADLMYETAYARATADLSAEYCAEFEQEGASSGAETHT